MAFGDVDPFSMDAISKYEEALIQAQKDGVLVKALFLCSPHNPLGTKDSKNLSTIVLTISKVAAIPEKSLLDFWNFVKDTRST